MDNNKNNNNQNAQNQNELDQNNANESGNNNNQNEQSWNNSQKQNNQNTGGTGAKTFTQEQVNRMMASEKNQGRAAAFKEMGIDPNDPNGANMMNMFKAFMSAMQTPEQQVQEQNAQQQIKIAEAESRAKKAEAKAEAMQLGILGQYVDDAVTIIMSKLDDKTDVKTIVGELKTKYPVWFDTNGNQQQNTDNSGNNQNNQSGQRGTGSSVGNVNSKGGGDNISGLGARLAAQRKINNKKSSFWD